VLRAAVAAVVDRGDGFFLGEAEGDPGLPLGGRVQADRDRHQSEGGRAPPHPPAHGVLQGANAMPPGHKSAASAIRMRDRPIALARYSAVSAARSRSSTLSPLTGKAAMPPEKLGAPIDCSRCLT